jgi:protein-S-isoprenylcysteine O-methyltransferase Ste14
MTVPVWGALGLGYAIASRIAYVLYVGLALRRQERSRHFTRRSGTDASYRRFKREASLLMTNDAVGLVAACVLGWHTLPGELPRGVMVVSGTILVIVGIVTKLWAKATLGGDAYYWANFFMDTPSVIPARAGPYRFFRNPMYTVGYLHTYGLALMTASLPGLIAALFDQAAILTFYLLVEKPHFDWHHDVATRERTAPREIR